MAVTLDDGRDENDEGTGRPADLKTAAPERRDQKAAHNGGIEPLLRRKPRADRNGHGQRQGDNGDSKTRDGVGPKIAPAIALAQNGDELGREEFGKGWPMPSDRAMGRHVHVYPSHCRKERQDRRPRCRRSLSQCGLQLERADDFSSRAEARE